MNLLDAFLLFPIAYAAYRGFVNGIVRELFTLAGMVAGFILVLVYLDPAAGWIGELLGTEDKISRLLAGMALFLGAVTLFQLLAVVLKRFLQWVQLNAVNRLLGSLFSVLKTATILSAILFMLGRVGFPDSTLRDESVSLPYIQPLAPAVFSFFSIWSSDWQETFDRFRDEVEERLPDIQNPSTI